MKKHFFCERLDKMFWVDLGKNRQFFHKLKFKAFKGSKAIALS